MNKNNDKDWPEAEGGFDKPTQALRSLEHCSPSAQSLIFTHPDREYSMLLQRMQIRDSGA